jgi:two-component system, NtrC family, sensor kinase
MLLNSIPLIAALKSLRRKTLFIGMVSFSTVILLAGVIFIGLAMSRQMKDIVSEQINQQQLGISRLIAARIEDSFNLISKELTVLNLSEALQYRDPNSWIRRMRITLSNLEEFGAEEIRQINARGNEVRLLNKHGNSFVSQGHFAEDGYFLWAKDRNNKGKIYVGDILNGLDETGHIIGRIYLAIPNYATSREKDEGSGSSQSFSGVVLLVVNVTRLVEKFIAHVTSGKTGYSWIIDDKGQFLFHPDKEFIGENAFAVREKREPKISFDAINRIQKEKMLTGQEGTGFYSSGWHRGLKGKIKKLIAYSPAFLSRKDPVKFWSVAVAAPVSEVEGVIHSLYMWQIVFQVVVVIALFAGGIRIILSELRYGKALKQEVQRAVTDLKESEERNRYLVESAEDIIVTIDKEGKIFSINLYGADQFEKPSRELLGRNLFDFFDPKSAAIQSNLLKRVFATKKSKSLEYQALIADKEVWLHANFKPLLDTKEEIHSILVIIRNITESKGIEQQLAHTEKLASLGSLAAGVAHEINNPLSIILGFTDILIEKVNPESQELEILKTIERQGLQCKKIVENLLSFARIPEKSVDFSKVNDDLEKVLVVVQNTLLMRKINLEKRFQDGLPEVRADSRQLQQVFLNIINNAIDAMAKGRGTLTITTRVADESDHVDIFFQDTGDGIAEDYLGKIFDPFFTTKGVGKGTGLGLSVSYAIINKFSGTISVVESKTTQKYPENSGTIFKISLPVKRTQGLIKGGNNG